MTDRRTLLAMLLGLVLLVQGFAVSAASFAAAPDPAAAAAERAAPPCHDGVAQDPQQAPAACCEEGCRHMAQCLLGHLAAAPVRLALPVFAAEDRRPARRPQALPAPRASSLLRPPIALHG